MGQVRNLKKTRLTPPGATAHVGAASEKAGVQGGCPRGGVFEKRTMQTTQKFGVYRQTSVSSVNQRPKPAVYVGSAALVNQSIIYHLPTRCSTYESDPDSSPRKEGKRVPRKLTSTLLYSLVGVGGKKSPKRGKKATRQHERLKRRLLERAELLLVARGPAWGLEGGVSAPTDVLVELSILNLIGGRESLKVALAGQSLEFEVLDNGVVGGGQAHASRFQGRRAGIRRDDCLGVRE